MNIHEAYTHKMQHKIRERTCELQCKEEHAMANYNLHCKELLLQNCSIRTVRNKCQAVASDFDPKRWCMLSGFMLHLRFAIIFAMVCLNIGRRISGITEKPSEQFLTFSLAVLLQSFRAFICTILCHVNHMVMLQQLFIYSAWLLHVHMMYVHSFIPFCYLWQAQRGSFFHCINMNKVAHSVGIIRVAPSDFSTGSLLSKNPVDQLFYVDDYSAGRDGQFESQMNRF